MMYSLKNLCVVCLISVFALGVVLSQDYEDFPTYSEDNLPQTSFSCKDKVHGGYYADIETDCQMYHVCHKNRFGKLRSTRFLCGNGTVFDQRHLVCQDYEKVPRCRDSAKYFRNTAALLELLEDDDYDAYSEDNLPRTSFSCIDKVNGGYYADIETDCQMYHVCHKNKNGKLRSTRFLCGNGTVFDQRHLVCQDYGKVPICQDSAKYYRSHASIWNFWRLG